MRRLACLGLIVGVVSVIVLPSTADAQPTGRLNRLVELLASGETVFGPFASPKGADAAAQMGRNRNVDYIFYDMEHAPFDVNEMRVYMQFLIDPARLIRRGRPGSDIAVLVRIPANGREMSQWMIKNVLDQGAHGIIAPHIETPEQALNVVRSMRYPPRVGATDAEPEGLRGSGAGNAARYWGVPGGEYVSKADVWPLDPQGELVNMIQIENRLGVENVDAIAKVPGVSMLMARPVGSRNGVWWRRRRDRGGDSDRAGRREGSRHPVRYHGRTERRRPARAAGVPGPHRRKRDDCRRPGGGQPTLESRARGR